MSDLTLIAELSMPFDRELPVVQEVDHRPENSPVPGRVPLPPALPLRLNALAPRLDARRLWLSGQVRLRS